MKASLGTKLAGSEMNWRIKLRTQSVTRPVTDLRQTDRGGNTGHMEITGPIA